ncbi:hypothetical protein BMG00_11235 [Thioclava marina]|uniref:DUF4258 domain-containing protein n=1 Tax=Thioclava marina TaxID=1915077 RepID=A0ABX3MJH1_9RHOB|nr:DUF4258 domain-containing protein [Thioclava marina]OOY11668.1 hypothetical protein BMG00_11235 [Thioclava marina]
MMIVTLHAAEQMEAREVTRIMALRVLRRGTIVTQKFRWDDQNSSWVAPVRGVTAGVEIDVVCAIRESDPHTIVVTVINRGAE